MISPVVATDPPALPDPVRLAFARLEAWKAACIVLALLSPPLAKIYYDTWGGSFYLPPFGWRSLGRASPFGAVLPWMLVKVLVVHLLLAVWFRRRPGAPRPVPRGGLRDGLGFGGVAAASEAEVRATGERDDADERTSQA